MRGDAVARGMGAVRGRATHTYVLMEVSQPTYDEIYEKLRDAGYDHVIQDGRLTMSGIAVTSEQVEQKIRDADRPIGGGTNERSTRDRKDK